MAAPLLQDRNLAETYEFTDPAEMPYCCDILQLRQKEMWPNKPLEYSVVEGDRTFNRHFGIWHRTRATGAAATPGTLTDLPGRSRGMNITNVQLELVSVLTVTVEPHESQARLRMFATDGRFRKLRLGTMVAKYVYSCLAAEGMRRVWCSARAEKVPYYQRHLNLRVISSIFEKGGLKFVFMESWLRDLKASSTFCRILKQVDGETSRVCVYAKL
ncbi:unnamed protein product [Symbiodinium natans]|uniref:Glycylpeptide N-tetradecanoyltransferase n=1 Tax=Symbiodinium natans TaxID=878477 RepID=A0A812REJ0_9DINO|nr:unnamed protein product [Symbiodinium natans]